jgi:hypothetical protein
LSTQSSAVQKDNRKIDKAGFIDRAGFTLRPLVNEFVVKAGPAADPWTSGTNAKDAALNARASGTGSR